MSKPVFENMLTFGSGRRNRKSFILMMLIQFLVFLFLVALVIVSMGFENTGAILLWECSNMTRRCLNMDWLAWITFSSVITILFVILLVFLSSFAIATQRLRDIGWTGWLALLMLVPLARTLLLIILIFKSGTQGLNRFGSNPLNSNRGSQDSDDMEFYTGTPMLNQDESKS